MYQIRVYHDEKRPTAYKTYNHKVAARANDRWKTCVSKHLKAQAVSPSGKVIMKTERGLCWRAVE